MMTTPSKIPLERAGTIREGRIYLKTEVARGDGEQFDVQWQGLNMIVASHCDVNADEFAWFRIVRAWEQNK